jgi:hypothetical protein
MLCRRTFALGLVVLCLISHIAVAQHYTITDLGSLSPTAINTRGQVVDKYNGHAFIWTKTGGMRDLGLLPGGTFSMAVAINDLGLVAVGPSNRAGCGMGELDCLGIIQHQPAASGH